MRSPIPYSSSGSFLSAVYAERQEKNRAYSLRAFARSLGVAPSYLLSLMSGKRSLSVERAVTVSERLKLDSESKEYFVNLVELERAKSEPTQEPLKRRLSALKMKSARRIAGKSSFSILSRWYYPAILAALDTNDLPASAQHVAAKLGLEQAVVEDALKTLEAKGWLKRNKDGTWIRSVGHVLLKSETTDLQLRHYHEAMLGLTKDVLSAKPPTSRVTRTETLAINREQLPKVKALVEDFIEQLVALAQEGDRRTEVFHLGLHFFGLGNETLESKPEKENEEEKAIPVEGSCATH